MTIKELRRYRQHVRRLAKVEEELERYSVCDSVEGSKGAPSFEKTTQVIEGYPHTERVTQLFDQRRWLRSCIQAIEDFIFSVDDERICNALIYYCMDERLHDKCLARAKKNGDCVIHVTWGDVAEAMCEPSGDTIRIAVHRYLYEHSAQ